MSSVIERLGTDELLRTTMADDTPDENGWFDISTAPKDGTRVDLWVRPLDAFANGNASRIPECWFRDGEWKRVIAGWTHNVSNCGEPTHWRPRPKPPLATQTQPDHGGRG